MKIAIAGFNGFIGNNFIFEYDNYIYENLTRSFLYSTNIFNNDIDGIINFIGKAHDIKSSKNFDEYYNVNFELTKNLFDKFLISNANFFITISSIKAVADESDFAVTEDFLPNPISDYGKTKLLAEEYILSKTIPVNKRVYILRPTLVHGPGNRGNLNTLYNYVKKGLPWPLGKYNNKRSFCSLNNLTFIINELILNDKISSGIYNICDDDPLSTNELIKIMSSSMKSNTKIWQMPKYFIKLLSFIGNIFNLSFRFENLDKLTLNFIVSNNKIKNAIKKPLPYSVIDGFKLTFNSLDNKF